MDKINKLIKEKNLAPLERTPPEELEKAKPLEKIPDARIVLDKMKESWGEKDLRKVASHRTLLDKLINDPSLNR